MALKQTVIICGVHDVFIPRDSLPIEGKACASQCIPFGIHLFDLQGLGIYVNDMGVDAVLRAGGMTLIAGTMASYMEVVHAATALTLRHDDVVRLVEDGEGISLHRGAGNLCSMLRQIFQRIAGVHVFSRRNSRG